MGGIRNQKMPISMKQNSSTFSITLAVIEQCFESYETCQCTGDMSVYWRHVSVQETCQCTGDMSVYWRHANVLETCQCTGATTLMHCRISTM